MPLPADTAVDDEVPAALSLLAAADPANATAGALAAAFPPPPGAPPPAMPGPGGVFVPLPPVLVQGLGTSIPELGRSTAAADVEAINRIAVQIVSMMERPW